MSDILSPQGLQDGWVKLYGEEAATDAEAIERRGLARIPYDFLIVKESDAACVVGAIQMRREAAARIREQAEKLAGQVERDADRLAEHFGGQLQEWTAAEIAGKKTRSVKLVTGMGGDEPATVGFRKVAGGLRIVDKTAAVEWAREKGYDDTMVSRTIIEAPVTEMFKQFYENAGDVPDGCEVKKEEDRFYIK